MDIKNFISQDKLDEIFGLVIAYAPKFILALITLFVGFWIIKILSRSFQKVLLKRQIEASLALWLGSVISSLLKILLLISVASMIGVETTSFIAMLGAAGLAIGLALQGSLANFAGGILILVFKPYKVGDFIIAQSEEGFVTSIDIFFTYLTTFDNKQIILPNGQLSNDKMVNVTKLPQRRVDLTVGISYGDNFKTAEEALIAFAKEDQRVLSQPAPFVGVTGYGDSSVNLTYRVWCQTEDYWNVYFDHNKGLKPALDKAQISIPFPQRDVHLFNQK